MDQPLALLNQMDAIGLTVDTYKFMRSEQKDMRKLTPTQRTLYRELERELQGG